ncbi:sulfite exporter TauE/SafE family protein [Phaeobacter sp.]|uniref:sulfite exporter TauE/SafE family protein n=1 Tax=Phaeobacter sp. TaxID=1902409 RepID=UPI0025D0FDF7|nr:sulfite exporter TauE/SafE family protein [Phaeobacter sp.]
MTFFDIFLLAVAAYFAGVANAIAGGGSFLTFPALVFTGVPAIAANATSAVAVFPGYLSGALGFFGELKDVPKRYLVLLLGLSLAGGVLGSLLLLVTPATVFAFVVPWLLGFATLLFAFGHRLTAWAERNLKAEGWTGNAATLLVCIYGGYFNGGLGIVLLALFSMLGLRDINLMNGLKNGMSFVLSGASVVTFALAGIVYWPQALLMMVTATIGGYCGAIAAKRLSAATMRALIICVGCVMTLIFALKG